MLDSNSKIDELEWIRIFDPVHIPKHLIEQIRDRDWSVDRFYQYQASINFQKDGSSITLNPLNLLFVLVDKEKKVQGFMWSAIEVLSNCLVINSFSIDKAYWNQGQAVATLEKKAREIATGAKLSKIYWLTNYPKHSEKHGFKRSKSVLMEYNLEDNNGQDNDGRRRQTSGTSGLARSRSDEIFEQHSRRTGSSSDEQLSEPITAVL
jgi:N-acetylglutamate synthase-like GNAT family acetyltransferase